MDNNTGLKRNTMCSQTFAAILAALLLPLILIAARNQRLRRYPRTDPVTPSVTPPPQCPSDEVVWPLARDPAAAKRESHKKFVAALTYTRNELVVLRGWLAHYKPHFAPEDVYVLGNDSEPSLSSLELGVNVKRFTCPGNYWDHFCPKGAVVEGTTLNIYVCNVR